MEKKLRITDIAMLTGFSASTVSRVLAGKANTSSRAREKILACAKQLGVMDGMALGRILLNNLVIFAPQRAFDERTDIFYFRIIQSISKTLSHYEVRLRYCVLDEFDSSSSKFLAYMNEVDTQAAILLGIDDPHIHDLAADYLKPCVMINCYDRRMRLPTVSPDHKKIGILASQFLFEMGHRRIMTVMCLRRYTMELRLAGIKETWELHNQNFEYERDLLTINSFSAKEAEEKVGEWLDMVDRSILPTAFLAGGDFIAAGIINALKKRNIRVPQDVSVMSIDGFNLATIEDVSLTAVHVPRDELGAEAIHMLQQRIVRPDATTGALLLYGKLVIRDSVRRIRSGKEFTPQPVKGDGLYDAQLFVSHLQKSSG
ncbi:LacI family DNA-binding transcriptional regulator [Escherichia coli]|uniref:LacI family DNA-binding transcriptional regulator n=1 Tax=Escherichia coli TaxID=562 RepID=UPI000BE4CA0B|nr:LacI family DNA-binding transcriptional regulator [Escherichia coli]